MTLTVGSLFSGIGGLEYGLELTGGFKTIWQCEIDPYASAVLRKHWADVPNLGDITRIEWDKQVRPDVICGGFPCQDISVAGKGAGIKEGTRSGLWFEYQKALRILRPKYAIIENVSVLPKRGLHIVLAGIAEAGYDALWLPISASDVGAWHKRERIFIIAYSDSSRRISFASNGRESEASIPLPERRWDVAADDKERNRWFSWSGKNGSDVSNTDNASTKGSLSAGRGEFRMCREISNPTSTGLEGRLNQARQTAGFGQWETEPDVGRVANGVPCWMDRIKCLGNAVVPQVAQVVGEMILEREKHGNL